MAKFRIRLLLLNGQWYSKNIIDKGTNYNATSTEWTFLNIGFLESIDGIKLVQDEKDTILADLCFSTIMIMLSVF